MDWRSLLLTVVEFLEDTADGTEETYEVPPAMFWTVFGSIFAVMFVIAMTYAIIKTVREYREEKQRKQDIEADAEKRRNAKRKKDGK